MEAVKQAPPHRGWLITKGIDSLRFVLRGETVAIARVRSCAVTGGTGPHSTQCLQYGKMEFIEGIRFTWTDYITMNGLSRNQTTYTLARFSATSLPLPRDAPRSPVYASRRLLQAADQLLPLAHESLSPGALTAGEALAAWHRLAWLHPQAGKSSPRLPLAVGSAW